MTPIFGAIFLVTSVWLSCAAEIIDGVIATVNRRPLLRSEWDEAVRFEAFMQQKRLADVSESERVGALQRLIDRELLNAQMVDARTLRPSDKEASADLSKLRAKIPGASDDANWHSLLASYALTESTIIAQLKNQVQVMNFIDVQLRPNIRIEEAEVQAYYRDRLLPGLRQNGAATVSLHELEPKIHELLVQQHMDAMLDAWLHNLRQQSHIQTLVPLPALNARAEPAPTNGD